MSDVKVAVTSAVDLVIDKVERQVQKQKGKIKLNRRRTKA
jgi:ribosome-associated translation inhibitor RaiA